MLLSWLHHFVTGPPQPKPKASRHRNRVRPCLEPLEDRTVPALIFTVNTLQDTDDSNIGNGEAKDANGNTSLRAAIQEGNAADNAAITIQFAQGLTGTISLGSVLPDFGKNYTIAGPGSANLTVSRDSMAARFRIFNIPNSDLTCSIQGLTISGGDTSFSGGAIANGGNLTLIGCKLRYNRADQRGGAVSNMAGTLTVSDCWVTDNQADWDGGAFYNGLDGTLNIVSGCKISSNSANNGGGIYIDSGSCTVSDASEISDNSASAYGGGVYNNGTFTMTGRKLEDNFSDVDGGGIYNKSGTSSLTGVSIRRNTASTAGGGFYVIGGTIAFDSCTISGNTATTGPGGVKKAPGTYTRSNCTITDEIVEIP